MVLELELELVAAHHIAPIAREWALAMQMIWDDFQEHTLIHLDWPDGGRRTEQDRAGEICCCHPPLPTWVSSVSSCLAPSGRLSAAVSRRVLRFAPSPWRGCGFPGEALARGGNKKAGLCPHLFGRSPSLPADATGVAVLPCSRPSVCRLQSLLV